MITSQRGVWALVAAVFVAGSAVAVAQTTSHVAVEPEDGALDGTAFVQTDATATGGEYVGFDTQPVTTVPYDFGFWHVHSGRDDPNDEPSTKTDYRDEVQGFSSITHIDASWQAPHFSIETDLQTTTDTYGMRSVVTVFRLGFLTETTTVNVGGVDYQIQHKKLRTQANFPDRVTDGANDYQTLIDRFVDNNASFLTPQYVKALHIIDEPLWRFSRTGDDIYSGCTSAHGATSASDLDAVSAYFEQKLPAIPQYFSESHNCVDETHVPSTVDFVSTHFYGVIDPANDDFDGNPVGDAGAYMINKIRALRDKLSANQHLWINLDAQYIPARYQEKGTNPEDMGAVAENYWAMTCLPEFQGRVDTVFAYRWPAGASSNPNGVLGARDFSPSIQNVYQQIHDRIVTERSCAPVSE